MDTTTNLSFPAPRIAKTCPVSVVIVKSSSRDEAIAIVSDSRGRTVEVIGPGYRSNVEQKLYQRYPWHGHYNADRYGLRHVAYPAATVEVAPRELRRLSKQSAGLDAGWDDAGMARMLRTADRCEAHALALEALRELRSAGPRALTDEEKEGVPFGHQNPYGNREHAAVIYHRTSTPAGRMLSQYLAKLVRHGGAVKEWGDTEHGGYRSTDKTPADR